MPPWRGPPSVENLGDHFWVERRGGLVEEHDLGSHGEGPGDGHALLLAPGELGREHVGLIGGPHP